MAINVGIDRLRLQHYNAAVVECRPVHPELFVLRVRPDAGVKSYSPGQWAKLGLGAWEPRAEGCVAEKRDDSSNLIQTPYSLSSSILDAKQEHLLERQQDYYEFYVAFDRQAALGDSGTALAARLAALKSACRLWVGDPAGTYGLPVKGIATQDDMVFIASGTGEAPHNQMIADLLRSNHQGQIVSVVSVRRLRDLGYALVHQRLEQLFANYRHVTLATQEKAKTPRLQEWLQSGVLEDRIGLKLNAQTTHVFLCGNWGMVGRPREKEGRQVFPSPPGMIELLIQRGLISSSEGGRLYYENY